MCFFCLTSWCRHYTAAITASCIVMWLLFLIANRNIHRIFVFHWSDSCQHVSNEKRVWRNSTPLPSLLLRHIYWIPQAATPLTKFHKFCGNLSKEYSDIDFPCKNTELFSRNKSDVNLKAFLRSNPYFKYCNISSASRLCVKWNEKLILWYFCVGKIPWSLGMKWWLTERIQKRIERNSCWFAATKSCRTLWRRRRTLWRHCALHMTR